MKIRSRLGFVGAQAAFSITNVHLVLVDEIEVKMHEKRVESLIDLVLRGQNKIDAD